MAEASSIPTPNEQRALLSTGNLTINLDNYQVVLDGHLVHLSFNEFELLALLMKNQDRVLPRRVITEQLWNGAGNSFVRRLNVLVHKLRAKLTPSSEYVIQSVRNRGYGLLSKNWMPSINED